MMHDAMFDYDSFINMCFQITDRAKLGECTFLIGQYMAASRIDVNASIPRSNDKFVQFYVDKFCSRLKACTLKHAKRSEINKENANKRWKKDEEADTTDDTTTKPKKEPQKRATKPKVKKEVESKKPEPQFVSNREMFECACKDERVRGVSAEQLESFYNTLEGMRWKFCQHPLNLEDVVCEIQFRAEYPFYTDVEKEVAKQFLYRDAGTNFSTAFGIWKSYIYDKTEDKFFRAIDGIPDYDHEYPTTGDVIAAIKEDLMQSHRR